MKSTVNSQLLPRFNRCPLTSWGEVNIREILTWGFGESALKQIIHCPSPSRPQWKCQKQWDNCSTACVYSGLGLMPRSFRHPLLHFAVKRQSFDPTANLSFHAAVQIIGRPVQNSVSSNIQGSVCLVARLRPAVLAGRSQRHLLSVLSY